MHSLRQFRSKAKGVADLLNYAALIDDGIVLCKDGTLLAGFYYRGDDVQSSTIAARNYNAARINAALAQFGSNWAMWFDANRLETVQYAAAPARAFPDDVTALIASEREGHFQAQGTFYESETVCLIAYTPPLRSEQKIVDLMYDDDPTGANSTADRALLDFKAALQKLSDNLAGVIKMRRMASYEVVDDYGRSHLSDELVNYLHFALTNTNIELNVSQPMYLDAYIGGQELYAGDTPKIGDQYICCVAIEGFPAESSPGILDVMNHLAIPYRWSSRMIYLDGVEADAVLKKYRRKWKQKVRGFVSQVFKTQGGVIDEDALQMASETEAALADASSGLVTFGYYTSIVVLMGKDRETLNENARAVAKEIGRKGFAARVETVNAMEAWLGSLPGHMAENVRRPLIHTLSLSDLIPSSHVWPGHRFNPCPPPFYPPQSPALLQGATTGATPFRFNLHVDDLGHTLVFGPTGAGKSVFLSTVASQFRGYAGSKVTILDKGGSAETLCLAVGGRHYHLGGDASPGLCPLKHLADAGDLTWAAEWIALCYQLQADKAPTPAQKQAIFRALELLRTSPQRSLTDFNASCQDEEVRAALQHYTIGGAMGHLLDSTDDGIADSDFTVFEIETLMSLGQKNGLPVLEVLFRRFEQSLKGQPSLLILDEAWLMLGHEFMREKIRSWLKELRKKNCAVILATQSLSDAVRSGMVDVLQESCVTKVFLPNAEAPNTTEIYKNFGLNEQEIAIIQNAHRKRHYYYSSPEGRRLFTLELGPVALSFVAVSDPEQRARVRSLAAAHGARWPYAWLAERGVDVTRNRPEISHAA